MERHLRRKIRFGAMWPGHFGFATWFHLAFLYLERDGQFSLNIGYVAALETLMVLTIVIGTDIQVANTSRASPEHHRHASSFMVSDWASDALFSLAF